MLQSLSYLQQESTPILPDSIWALSWTPSNKLISGSADGHLRVWDANELSKPIHDISSHPLAISSLSTSSDGKKALATSLDGTVILVDVDEGSQLAKVETGREKAVEGEHACWAWSGRSSRLAIRPMANSTEPESNGSGEGSGRGVLGGEGKVIDTGKGKFGMDLKFSPDGRSLALATEQGHVVVVDTETQSWLYSGSDDHLIVLYDVRAGSRSGSGGKGEGAVAMMQGHQSWVLKVAASPDSKLLGSGGADSTVKLWDVGQRSCVSTSTGNAEVWGLDWQPAGADTFAAGKQFAIAGDDKAITLYRAAGSA
ncbi:hypothetical protein CI109_107309 [Kwoniella shandongensis]|uniref:Anaphase-promoting complex subunit 4 WD40 domain-containing protein n=1 Tax=Kwoniella shandongensis TaxID=1734106 RepID=A0AAJ8LT75_9TREE